MNKNTFSQQDYDVVIEFLNHVATKGEFKHTVKESIMFVKLLNKMQTEILPKIKDNIFQIEKVVTKKQSNEEL